MASARIYKIRPQSLLPLDHTLHPQPHLNVLLTVSPLHYCYASVLIHMSNNNDNNIYSLIFLPDIESIEMWSRMFRSTTNQPTNQPMTQWLSDIRELQSAILLSDLCLRISSELFYCECYGWWRRRLYGIRERWHKFDLHPDMSSLT